MHHSVVRAGVGIRALLGIRVVMVEMGQLVGMGQHGENDSTSVDCGARDAFELHRQGGTHSGASARRIRARARETGLDEP